MAQTTSGSSRPLAVISRQYCSANPIELTISRNVWKMHGTRYVIKDMNGNIIFKVHGMMFMLVGPYTIFDASERPVVTLKIKTFSLQRRWQVFRGESTNKRDLIFSAKQSWHHVLFKTKLDVFLANNMLEDKCDYSFKAAAFISSGDVYFGKTSNKIAHMEREFSFFGNQKFTATVCPNVDHAFVVALIIILDEIHQQRK